MEASWADLDPNLLEMILDRLPVPDCFRFPVVCTTWCRVQRDHRLHHPTSVPQIPWLINKFSRKQCIFQNPSEQRYYDLPLPATAKRNNCCGCSRGWLLFLRCKSQFLLLVNPITLSEIHIPVSQSMLQKISRPCGVLSSCPTDPDCIVLLWESTNYFGCRIRDKNWTHWPVSRNLLSDVPLCVFFDGNIGTTFCGGNIYTNYGGSKLIVVEPLPSNVVRRLDIFGQPFDSDMEYFLESDGELLLASVFLEQHGHNVLNIEIYRADLSRKLWVRLESLVDRVLFLGLRHSFSLPAANTGGPGNRIYLTWLPEHVFFCERSPGQLTTTLLWIEYNYERHEVIRRNLQEWGKAKERFCFIISHWFMPSLC